jgi:hypothetical protein
MASFFMIGYLVQQRLITNSPVLARAGIICFVSGVLLNEMLLMMQGIAAISYTGLPVVNYLLLGAVIMMFAGLLFFSMAQWRKS